MNDFGYFRLFLESRICFSNFQIPQQMNFFNQLEISEPWKMFLIGPVVFPLKTNSIIIIRCVNLLEKNNFLYHTLLIFLVQLIDLDYFTNEEQSIALFSIHDYLSKE